MILLMYAYTTLADAAKDGVRYAIVHGTGASTANGGAGCSGPGGNGITCSDLTGANVQSTVINFSGLAFQTLTTSEVTVNYNPNNVNGANCNLPGCMVRVSVSHNYSPLFGLGWASFTMNAAAEGRIMN